MDNIVRITNERRQRHELFRVKYKDIKFIELLEHALSNFYTIRTAGFDHQPQEYNPIVLFGIMSCFDPYMVEGMQAGHLPGTEDYAWKPWPVVNGIERTKLFIKEELHQLRKKYKENIKINESFSDYIEKQDAIARNYLYLKEDLSDNSIVLTIVDNYDNFYKRILIEDVKQICGLLARGAKYFPKVLEYPHDYKATRAKNDREVLDCLKNGNDIPIKDENVALILEEIGITL